MAQLGKDRLKEGVCYALAHSVHLIEDAVILYLEDRISSSFHLAIMAREELGRATILWKKADGMTDEETVEAESLAAYLREHKIKLDAGQSTTHVRLKAEMVAALTTAIQSNDRVALDKIHRERKRIVSAVRKHDPDRLHKSRLKAQYVDLNSDGSWSNPSDTKKMDAQTIVLTVAVEIGGTLAELESDRSLSDICAKTNVSLPSYAAFEARVTARLLRVSPNIYMAFGCQGND
ncbi:MAG: AbiV family abortive infection protein [Pseudomonadota bacterium]